MNEAMSELQKVRREYSFISQVTDFISQMFSDDSVVLHTNCYALKIKCMGTWIILVDNAEYLYPGESLEIGSNPNELMVRPITFRFVRDSGITDPYTGQTNLKQIVATRKVYVK